MLWGPLELVSVTSGAAVKSDEEERPWRASITMMTIRKPMIRALVVILEILYRDI
jgi:hypothetical protein